MAFALSRSQTFSWACDCCVCGVPVIMSDDMGAKRREDHKFWYCLNGHSQHFTGKSELEKTRELLETERKWRTQERAAREAAERSLQAQKAVTTRIKNRVGNGVCPCCNRTFQNLMRHMSSKHPDYSKEQA